MLNVTNEEFEELVIFKKALHENASSTFYKSKFDCSVKQHWKKNSKSYINLRGIAGVFSNRPITLFQSRGKYLD